MNKLFIEDLSIKNKKVLMRVDFNVPLDHHLNITDPTRIQASLFSINYVLNQGGALILMSHLGRPKNQPRAELSLKPCAQMLSELLGKEVKMAPDCVGYKVEEMAKQLKPGQILLLENLRFHRAEEHPDEDPQFAKKLASLADVYVNDAFGTAHRAHSSTYTVAHYFPKTAAAGYLIAKEVRFLGNTLNHPKPPLYALIGGAKISSKIEVIKALLKKVDGLLIGGGMAYTFLKAQGFSIGKSLCEDEFIPVACQIINECREKKLLLIFPFDFKIAQECSNDAPHRIVTIEQGIPPDYEGLDIGPQSIDFFIENLNKAETILWNGPMGVYEFDNFAIGTQAIAKALGKTDAITIIGGGDSIAAINSLGLADQMTHLSTGGGATLEFIEKGTLPGIEALSSKKLINIY